MNIVFNAFNTNFGDTGGCLSVVESADILRKQGHHVDIVVQKNCMTWRKLSVLRKMPKTDICIGISTADIESTMKAKAKKKAVWLRGPEWKFDVPWFPSKDKLLSLLDKFTKVNGKILCNANWLTAWMIRHGFMAKTCYVGFDLNLFKDHGQRPVDVVIGCLKSKRASKRYKDFLKLEELLGHTDYQYCSYGHKHELHGEQLTRFYNQCRIWFTPSVLEGFHRVPAEAALCGCLVVAVDDERGGTADWLVDCFSGLRYKSIMEAVGMIRNVISDEIARNSADAMVAAAKHKLAMDIGSKESCMKKLVEAIND